MKDLHEKLLAAFKVEYSEHLEKIRNFLEAWESAGGKYESHELDEVFRRAHSLKGAARAVDISSVELLAHRLETLFSRVRESSLRLDLKIIHVIKLALDNVEDLVESSVEKKSPPDFKPVLDRINRILDERETEETVSEELSPTVEEKPTEIQRNGKASEQQHGSHETVRINANTLDRLMRTSGNLLNETIRQATLTGSLKAVQSEITDIQKEWQRVRKVAGKSLRQLPNMPGLGRIAGYLEYHETHLRSLASRTRNLRLLQQRTSWSLHNLGEQLQDDVRQARMISVESVFQGFRKMVRDVAKDQGKELDFRLSGFHLAADRMVLQELKDPVMHLVRNAISHGIETPNERERQGKKPVGQLKLSIEIRGNRLILVVEDDGQGVDVGKVKEAGIRHGLISESAAEKASPEEVLALIFQPGFSTATSISKISGRGIGLSVVADAVTRLQGEVQVKLRKPQGTRFVVSVPQSFTSQRLLLVEADGQTFCLPIHAIERLTRVRFDDLQSIQGKPVISIREQPIPVISLSALLKRTNSGVKVANEMITLVVVRALGEQVAIAVDALQSIRDGLIVDIGIPSERIAKFSGGMILEDGSVALVVNVVNLFRDLAELTSPAFLSVEETATESETPAILVVDDSITTRTLEKSILEAEGYDVRVAVDGVEAFQLLKTDDVVDLVITDIEMPRMDGFTLVERMKADDRLAQLPVIVVTSLEKKEDKERGLSVGADAYVVKRKFDQKDLLDAIKQLL